MSAMPVPQDDLSLLAEVDLTYDPVSAGLFTPPAAVTHPPAALFPAAHLPADSVDAPTSTSTLPPKVLAGIKSYGEIIAEGARKTTVNSRRTAA